MKSIFKVCVCERANPIICTPSQSNFIILVVILTWLLYKFSWSFSAVLQPLLQSNNLKINLIYSNSNKQRFLTLKKDKRYQIRLEETYCSFMLKALRFKPNANYNIYKHIKIDIFTLYIYRNVATTIISANKFRNFPHYQLRWM